MTVKLDDLIGSYLAECQDHLATIETDLLAIENAGANIDENLINKVFRAAHSIKGGAGYFGLNNIQDLAHKTENVLSMIRSREMVPNAEIINILLQSFDQLNSMLNNPAESDGFDTSETTIALLGLTSVHLPQEEKSSLVNKVTVTVDSVPTEIKVTEFDLTRAQKDGMTVYLLEIDLIHDVQRQGRTPLDIFRDLNAHGQIIECVFKIESVGTLDDEPSNKIPFQVLYASKKGSFFLSDDVMLPIDRFHIVAEAQTNPPKDETLAIEQVDKPNSVEAVQTQTAPSATATMEVENIEIRSNELIESHDELSEQTESKASNQFETDGKNNSNIPSGGGNNLNANSPQIDQTLRVNVTLLESLMNLAGELVLGRNQLVDAISRNDNRQIKVSSQRINLVTSELQETIMLTRMQTIGNIFNKFPRVIRDLSKDLNKEIKLLMAGKDVEMDKTIIEGLSDPLTHMVRNAADHGIESPEIRAKRNKNPVGTVKLNAYHEAGQVVIEIADDGQGIDADKVTNMALKKGLITIDQVKTMSAKEKMALIFLPGLSTADKVTGVSGRGVGMDVVKTNLDKLGGKVEIDSEIGMGTSFRIKLPLTLAIIPSLLVSMSNERFAIPQVNINELIRIPADQIKRRIEIVGDAEVLILRGTLIPIIRLADVLGIEKSETEIENKKDLNIVVVSAGVFQYGLIVEKLHETLEIVVKPLGQHLKGSREYAGATIMGDGHVALILDVSGLAAKFGLTSMINTKRAKELAEEVKDSDKQQNLHAFLLFKNASNEHAAIPLDLVARVEHVQNNQIEIVGGKRIMQYRGSTLPLVTLKDAVHVDEIKEVQEKVVLVFEIYGREVGLLATKPVDVVETSSFIDQTTIKQKGLIGSAIIKGQTTMIVDIYELVESVYPEWATYRGQIQKPGEQKLNILLAEDSEFFRNQVKKFIESAGFNVIAAEDGQMAWELLQKNAEKIKLVVTDIEMPRMTGFALTQNIRASKKFADLPVIAVTSLASNDDINNGKNVGITDYQVKLDKEKLLDSINNLLGLSNASEQIQ